MRLVTVDGKTYIDREDGGGQIPKTIRPRQLWLALLTRNITRAQVDAIVATLPADQQERVKIEMMGHVYDRESPWIGTFGAALGLSESDIDQLFTEGQNL